MSCDGSKMHLREIYVSQSVRLVGLALILCCSVNFRKSQHKGINLPKFKIYQIF